MTPNKTWPIAQGFVIKHYRPVCVLCDNKSIGYNSTSSAISQSEIWSECPKMSWAFSLYWVMTEPFQRCLFKNISVWSDCCFSSVNTLDFFSSLGVEGMNLIKPVHADHFFTTFTLIATMTLLFKIGIWETAAINSVSLLLFCCYSLFVCLAIVQVTNVHCMVFSFFSFHFSFTSTWSRVLRSLFRRWVFSSEALDVIPTFSPKLLIFLLALIDCHFSTHVMLFVFVDHFTSN